MKKWRLTKLFCRNSFRLTDKICYPQSSYINLLSPFFIYFLLATRWNSKMHYALLWLIKLIKMLMKMNLEVDSLSRLTSVVTYLKVSLPVSNVARKCSIISPDSHVLCDEDSKWFKGLDSSWISKTCERHVWSVVSQPIKRWFSISIYVLYLLLLLCKRVFENLQREL